MNARLSRYLGATGLALLIVASMISSVGLQTGSAARWLFATGGVLVLVALTVSFRSVTAFTRIRSVRYGANTFLMIVLFTTILVVIQTAAVRNVKRYDLTSNQRHTLTAQTVSLLQRLDRDIDVKAFFRSGNPRRQDATDLLSMYALQTPHIRYEFIDPDRHPSVAEEMKAGYGQIVVTCRSNRHTIDEVSEEKLTNAIMLVTRDVQKTLYFVTGHAEKSLRNSKRRGYSFLAHSLESEGYRTQPLTLVDIDEIPMDCSVLVVAGPEKDYLSSEVDKIASYLAGGGNALFMIDPRKELPNLFGLLASYRVALDDIVLLDELVVDAGDQVFDATVTKIRRYGNHAITRDFHSITMFPMARPVRIADKIGFPNITATYLALAEPSVWGETDMNSFKVGQATRDQSDVKGPHYVALVTERSLRFDPPTPESRRGAGLASRLVVIGDSDFVTNSFYGVLGNADFFLRTVSYLAEDDDLISIRRPPGKGDQIYMTASQGRLVFVLCIVLLPLAVISTGTWVLVRNRGA